MNTIRQISASCLMTALFLSVHAAEVDVGDGANDNTYSDNVSYARADRIVKTGTGKTTLSFGNATSSFNKEIEVREGTLAVAQYPLNFGSPTKITVSSGATLDISWSESAAGNLNKAEIVISGTGVNGAGAICRTSGDNINGLLGTVTLAGDALIKHVPQIGFVNNTGIVNLNGHTLSVHAGTSVFYCPGTLFKDNGAAASGGLTILSGTFFPRYSFGECTGDNVLTLKNGTSLRFRDLSTKPKWKIVTEGTVTFTADSVGNNPEMAKTWDGPVELGGQLTLFPKAQNTFFTIAGNISNNCNVVMDSSSKGQTTLSGSNDVNAVTASGGTLCVTGGMTVAHGVVTVSSGGTLAVSNAEFFLDYERMTLVTIEDASKTPRLIVGTNAVLASHDLGGNYGAAARLYAGRNAGRYGTLEVHAGAVVSNVMVNLGSAGNGALYQTGGTVFWPPRSGDVVADATNSYAYYGIGGAFTLDAGNFASTASGVIFGRTGTVVVAVRDGGSLKVAKSAKVVHGAASGSSFVYYQDNGRKNAFDQHLYFGSETGAACSDGVELTVAGPGSELEVWLNMNFRYTNALNHVAVNLNDGGTLAARYMNKTSVDCPWYFNLNGGILKPRRSFAVFSGGIDDEAHRPTRTTVYEKGFAIDTSDTMNENRSAYDTATMHLSFAAPPEGGLRVKSIALPTDAGFASEKLIGPPRVTITGDGAGASAFALFDDVSHTLTNIVVTSPGWGYTEATATLSAGGLANAYSCAVTLEPQPTDGWKCFTKRGAQRLNMLGANTFKGDITVEEGILGFLNEEAAQGGMPEGAGATVKEGAILTFPNGSTPVTVPFLAGCGTTSYGTFTVTNRIECTADEVFAGKHLTVNQNLTLADGVKIVVTDPENLAKYRDSKPAAVVACGKTITANGTVSLAFADGSDEKEELWCLAVKEREITLGYLNGTMIIFR